MNKFGFLILLVAVSVVSGCGEKKGQEVQAIVSPHQISIEELNVLEANSAQTRSQLDDIALAGADGTDDYHGWWQKRWEQLDAFSTGLEEIKAAHEKGGELSDEEKKIVDAFAQLQKEVAEYWTKVGFPISPMTADELKDAKARTKILREKIQELEEMKIEPSLDEERRTQCLSLSISLFNINNQMDALEKRDPKKVPKDQKEQWEKSIKTHLPRLERLIAAYEKELLTHKIK